MWYFSVTVADSLMLSLLSSKSMPSELAAAPLVDLLTFSAWSFLRHTMVSSSIACVHSGASERSAVLAAEKRRS